MFPKICSERMSSVLWGTKTKGHSQRATLAESPTRPAPPRPALPAGCPGFEPGCWPFGPHKQKSAPRFSKNEDPVIKGPRPPEHHAGHSIRPENTHGCSHPSVRPALQSFFDINLRLRVQFGWFPGLRLGSHLWCMLEPLRIIKISPHTKYIIML